MGNHFADIILPFAVKGRFTYRIPDEFSGEVMPGHRVLVQFGNKKLYSGIVGSIHDREPGAIQTRQVLKVLDNQPLVDPVQLKFWNWLSDYYMCKPGEVMKAALPSDLCLEGVTSVPVEEKYKPRTETYVRLASDFAEADLNLILDKLEKAPAQSKIMLTFLRLAGADGSAATIPVKKSQLLRDSGSSPDAFEALIKKNLLTPVKMNIDRLHDLPVPVEPVRTLSPDQARALNEINNIFRVKDTVLLHGVTSSGKTEIYTHLIEDQLSRGRQVLYLLPEIALTTQIIERLRRHFGSHTGVYHSRFSQAEKVEIWKRVAGSEPGKDYKLIIGVRSAIFLPFRNLGLIIVDEEQDGSYKQHDPAPRYHARDAAIILAGLHNAKTIVGSASPSVESYNNALTGKYGLVEINERFGNVRLPEIVLANSREAYRKKLMVSHFTPELLEAIDRALGDNEQIILFQNRRGFSPYIQCPECGWIPKCIRCDVNLTYHKGISSLVCHYCGYTSELPHSCTSCHSTGLTTRGFGTEKIEDEIKIVFPSARVARMDQDTTRGRNSFHRLITAFEERRIDILIGTQMISKGLDFENLTVVGVLNADNLLNFPDFRAHERSFHLMEQVSGRAGRRKKPGKVVIQTSDPSNKIIRLVLHHDYKNMFRMQSEERRTFNYPPYTRMIKITIRHRDRAALNGYSSILGGLLKKEFGKMVLGPEFPVISQIQSWYIKDIILKLDRERPLIASKKYIAEAIGKVENEKGASALRISVDVDPY